MSYAGSSSLQQAVYQELIANSEINALVGSNVFDAVPSGNPPSLYISLGPETVVDMTTKSDGGARHDFLVSVVAENSGFQAAKELAAAVSDALVDAQLSLSRGTLVGLWFRKAKAARTGRGGLRRIDMTFRAAVEGL